MITHKLKRSNPTMFEIIKQKGHYSISIQGSKFHYCSPRQTINPKGYNSMEIAIFYNGNWTKIKQNKTLKAFSRYNELLSCCEDPNGYTQVYGWLDIEIINDLYKYLLNK